RDLVDVPLAGGLRHRIDLGEVDDRARAIARLGPRIPDVDLVAIFRRQLLRIGTANVDAAVGVRLDPEFGPDLEIAIAVLADQETVALVGDDRAVLDAPVGVADLVEVVEALAVEQRNPSVLA